MIFVTGDIHGEYDIHKLNSSNFKEGRKLTKEDYLIICGDFGLVWDLNPGSKETRWINWLNDKKWTTLFVDGNHENFDRLLKYPEIDMFGDKVGKIHDSIYHLKRGRIYTINNQTFFTMGGAYSVDKYRRTEFITWWKEEQPSYKEYQLALINLEKYNYKVDYIISHTGPTSILHIMLDGDAYKNDNVSKFFDEIKDKLTFKKWYFGHLHENKDYDKFHCLYNTIIKI